MSRAANAQHSGGGPRPDAGCSRDQKRKIRLVYTEIYQVEQSIYQDIPRETKKYTEIYPVIPSYRMLYRVIPSYTDQSYTEYNSGYTLDEFIYFVKLGITRDILFDHSYPELYTSMV